MQNVVPQFIALQYFCNMETAAEIQDGCSNCSIAFQSDYLFYWGVIHFWQLKMHPTSLRCTMLQTYCNALLLPTLILTLLTTEIQDRTFIAWASQYPYLFCWGVTDVLQLQLTRTRCTMLHTLLQRHAIVTLTLIVLLSAYRGPRCISTKQFILLRCDRLLTAAASGPRCKMLHIQLQL